MRGIATVTMIVLLAGCAKKETPPPTTMEPTDIAASAREAAYPMPQVGAGTIQLSGGTYRDSVAGLDVRIVATATGEIDGDDRSDAAVILASQTGGTGTFMDLYAVLDHGLPATRGPVSLGDRVKVDSIRVSDRAVHLHVLTHAPNDPLCCPTRHEVETFVLHADTLMRRPAEQP